MNPPPEHWPQTSPHVARVLARDDLLLLAADADQAVGIVRQRQELARRAEDEPTLFAVALDHYRGQTTHRNRSVRSQAWDYSATIVRFCAMVGIAVSSDLDAAELYARALDELQADSQPDRDLFLGVTTRYRAARNLRMNQDYAAALKMIAKPPEFTFATGAEPHFAHYLYERGACLISAGQAAQVPAALDELGEYWATRAGTFPFRHRVDFVQGLAAWQQGRLQRAGASLESALVRLQSTGRSAGDGPGTSPTADEARRVQELSETLTQAEFLAANGRTDADARRATALGSLGVELAEHVRGRWRVIARSRTPLAVAFRRIYGDIALLADSLPNADAAVLGFRVALAAKQTGFAARIRAGRMLISPNVSELLEAVVRVEENRANSLVETTESRSQKLAAYKDQISKAATPMLADTILPAPAELGGLLAAVGGRYALDVVSLPDTLGRDNNWFRTLLEPNQTISFERFVPGEAFTGYFQDRPGRPKWSGRLGKATDGQGPDWRGLACEILPSTLLARLAAASRDQPIELLISAHSTLSMLPWAALEIDGAGTRLVERAIVAQSPVFTCLADDPVPPVAGPALVRLVSRAERGVGVAMERDAWGIPLDDHDRVPLSRWAGPADTQTTTHPGRFLDAVRGSDAGWGFVHIATHGKGSGLEQYLWLPEPGVEDNPIDKLTAGLALGVRWPSSVLMASCHVGQLVNAEDAEPLNFVMALLTGGSRCVVAGIDAIPDYWTGTTASHVVDQIRGGPIRLDVALRKAQLDVVAKPVAGWALLAAYAR
jgi:tetratricopeptide (TPR) repeat protein